MEELLSTTETGLACLKASLTGSIATIGALEQEISKYRASMEPVTPTETETLQLQLTYPRDYIIASPVDSAEMDTVYYET